MMEARQNLNMYERKRKDRGDRHLLDSTRHVVKENWMPGMKKALKPVPLFKQREGEDIKSFYNRMHLSIDSMKQQREYEKKFKVEVQRDQQGNSKVVDAEVDEIDQLMEEKKNKRLKNKKGIVVKSREEKRKLRREREKLRKNKKKNKNSEVSASFDDFQDTVGFGETVHAPPSISFKNKKLDLDAAERKPANSGLLLAKKFNGGVKKSAKNAAVKPSLAKQAIMEKERQRVVEAYRALKAERSKR